MNVITTELIELIACVDVVHIYQNGPGSPGKDAGTIKKYK